MSPARELSIPQRIWKTAITDTMSRHERYEILEYGLAESLLSHHPRDLEKMARFLDPQTPCAALAGDPGWSIYRRPESGERHRYFSSLNARSPNRPEPWPVPGPEEAATPDWPVGMRYRAQADVPEDLWDPAYPEEYFTAAEVHAYLSRLMPVYAKYHPESAAACAHVVSLSQHWVDLDAKAGQG